MFGSPFPGSAPISRNYLGLGTTVSASTVDRYIIAVIAWFGGSLSSATIAGVAATILVQGSNAMSAAIIAAKIPAGVSGSVSLNSPSNFQADLYEVLGWEGSVLSTGRSSGLPSSVAINTPENTVIIAVVAASDGNAADPTASATWTILSEDEDAPYGVANARYISAASLNPQNPVSATVTCTHTHTSSAQFCALAVLGNS